MLTLGLDTKEKLAVGRVQWEKRFTWKGMGRKIEDEKSGWGEQIHIEWNELGVDGVDQWTDLVEDRGWLRRTLGNSEDTDSEDGDAADD